MDQLDSKLLNLIQKGIPLTECPFHDLAKELGIPPEMLLERLQHLKADGYIRRIGGVFNTAKMGYQSILVAMEVPSDRIIEATNSINSHPEITHNYVRNNRLNIWFTLANKNETERTLILQEITAKSGSVNVYEFPALKHFKLNVFFDMEEGNV